MAAISEAKRAANRENAKKSTGPKTVEGKERSRANALKHGLTGAGVVTADHLKEEAQSRIEEWTAALGPKTGPERWLVERAAVDSARVDAAVSCERARCAARLRNDALYTRVEGIGEAHVAKLGVELIHGRGDVRSLRLRLLATRAGCEFLIGRWEEIARRQEQHGGWKYLDFSRAELLMGQFTRDGAIPRRLAAVTAAYLTNGEDGWELSEHPSVQEIASTRRILINRLHNSGWSAEMLLAPEEHPDRPDCRERADELLRLFVSEELAELHARRDELAEIEALDAAESSERLLVDLSPEGVLLHRYEHELHRRVHQSLRELERLRKMRGDDDSPSVPAPEPAPAPPPPPPAPAPRNEATAAAKSAPRPTPPPPLPSPFRDGGEAANRPMSLHMPMILPPNGR